MAGVITLTLEKFISKIHLSYIFICHEMSRVSKLLVRATMETINAASFKTDREKDEYSFVMCNYIVAHLISFTIRLVVTCALLAILVSRCRDICPRS